MTPQPVTPVWIKVWTAWAIALAVLILFFIVVEGVALARNGIGDTLSETVWYLRERNSWLYWLVLDVVYLTTVTMAWLIWHFRFTVGRTE